MVGIISRNPGMQGSTVAIGRMKNRRVASPILPPAKVASFVEGLFHDDLHAKRVRSLSDATMGAIHAGAIGVHAIGRVPHKGEVLGRYVDQFRQNVANMIQACL